MKHRALSSRKHKTLRLLAGIVIALLSLAEARANAPQAAPAQAAHPVPQYVPDELLVKFRVVSATPRTALSMGSDTLNSVAQSLGIRALTPLFDGATAPLAETDQIYKVALPKGSDVEAAADAMGKDPGVEFAEPNYIYHTLALPAKPQAEPEAALVCDPQVYYGVRHCSYTDGKADIILVDLQDPHVRVQMAAPRQNPDVLLSPDNVECNSVNRKEKDPSSNCGIINPNKYPVEKLSEYLDRYKQQGAVAAINTDYFGLDHDHGAQGLAIRNGERLDGITHGVLLTASNAISQPSLSISKDNRAIISVPPSEDAIEAGKATVYSNTVAGAPQIMISGEVTRTNCPGDYPGIGSCTDTSQSAAGINADGSQLVLMTARVNAYDVAQRFKNLPSTLGTNASVPWQPINAALKFDGGGSSRLAWLDASGQIKQFSGIDKSSLNYEDRQVPQVLIVFSTKIPIPSPVTATDPLFKYQYALNNTEQTGGKSDADIDAPEAWGVNKGSTNTLIAVIDSGVAANHDDLNDGQLRTDIDKDYVSNDDDADDETGHGTHVTGIIAATANNGFGTAGILWQAKILPLKVCGTQGCNSDSIAKAIRYAADMGARVMNMSLGGTCSSAIADAINYAHFTKGAVIVAASGNDGSSVNYPAAHDPVIAVGATDKLDAVARFSSRGSQLDLTAPGVSIWSTVPKNGHDTMSGTSMASPHVAAAAGLLLSQSSGLTNEQVREILRQSTDDLGPHGFDNAYGHGRLNAYNALVASIPANPAASGRAECPVCAAVATANTANDGSGADLLSTVRAVRDTVFTSDPGRRWSRIYYENQFEVAGIVLRDGAFRSDVLQSWQVFNPVFQALSDGNPASPLMLSRAHVNAAQIVMLGVADRGSPQLKAIIQAEWQRVDPERLVGMSIDDAWVILQRENATETRVHLPLVVR